MPHALGSEDLALEPRHSGTMGQGPWDWDKGAMGPGTVTMGPGPWDQDRGTRNVALLSPSWLQWYWGQNGAGAKKGVDLH